MKTVTDKQLYKVGYWALVNNKCIYMVGHWSALELLMVKKPDVLNEVGQVHGLKLLVNS